MVRQLKQVAMPEVKIQITLRPSRMKLAILVVGCLLFVIGGVWLASIERFVGYLCVGFFSLGLVVFALLFHPKAAYLHLSPDGFTTCSLFRARTFRWASVSEFAVITVSTSLIPMRMVAWNFVPDCRESETGRAISKSLCGYESALPDTYGMKAKELVKLMERLRREYGENPKRV